jgi:hypothetical protein
MVKGARGRYGNHWGERLLLANIGDLITTTHLLSDSNSVKLKSILG